MKKEMQYKSRFFLTQYQAGGYNGKNDHAGF